ncbi:TPA: fimb protein, partial [Neisseria gonorrhoeae]
MMENGKTFPRWRFALKSAGWHLLISLLVAGLAALLVFKVWYPYPYAELTGGLSLYQLVVAVDIVCGPLLTLILASP